MINFTRLLGGVPSVSAALKAVSKKKRSTAFASCRAFSPLVVFNLTQRCNLDCLHCYLTSEDRKYRQELSFKEIKKVIDSLSGIDIPVLLLSGGEPLVHKDIFKIITYAKGRGIRVGLSTNGTLISPAAAKKLKKTQIDYIGVSIDGARRRHDRFRNLKGAYDKALAGIRNAREQGLKTGVRFTLSRLNAEDLPSVLEMCVKEEIPRFCLYHLVYAGRGEQLYTQDIDNKKRRKIVDFLIKKTLEYKNKQKNIEILTVDNHADGIYIYNFLKKKNPEQAKKVLKLLKFHGGCSAGTKIVDISPKGEVFACQFWQSGSIGNVRDTGFRRIWLNKDDRELCRLRMKWRYLKGKCGKCRYKTYCGGCRIRAFAASGDFWQEDPCCYLSEKEIR